MPLSTDINLPRNHVATFPDLCVACGRAQPESQTRIITSTLSIWTWYFWWIGKPFHVKVPTCYRCGWLLHARRATSLLITLAVILAVFIWVWPHFEGGVPHGLQKWALLALIVACLIPKYVFDAFRPPPFDTTAYSKSVDYEFRSKDYAIEFAALNLDAEWITIRTSRFASDDD